MNEGRRIDACGTMPQTAPKLEQKIVVLGILFGQGCASPPANRPEKPCYMEDPESDQHPEENWSSCQRPWYLGHPGECFGLIVVQGSPLSHVGLFPEDPGTFTRPFCGKKFKVARGQKKLGFPELT